MAGRRLRSTPALSATGRAKTRQLSITSSEATLVKVKRDAREESRKSLQHAIHETQHVPCTFKYVRGIRSIARISERAEVLVFQHFGIGNHRAQRRPDFVRQLRLLDASPGLLPQLQRRQPRSGAPRIGQHCGGCGPLTRHFGTKMPRAVQNVRRCSRSLAISPARGQIAQPIERRHCPVDPDGGTADCPRSPQSFQPADWRSGSRRHRRRGRRPPPGQNLPRPVGRRPMGREIKGMSRSTNQSCIRLGSANWAVSSMAAPTGAAGCNAMLHIRKPGRVTATTDWR